MKPLVTAFGPFQSRPRNGSATLLAALRTLPGWGGRADFLFLPVAWSSLEFLVRPAVAGPRPWALGIGEGKPGQAVLERRARNERSGRDESGAGEPGLWVKDGPQELWSRLPETLGETVSIPKLIRGTDAGIFLCNGLLWALLESPAEHAAFLHLPPQGETPDEAYVAEWLPVLRAVLTRLEIPNRPVG